MKAKSANLKLAVATLLITGLSTAAHADRGKLAYADEIETCVAAVSERIDLTSANRVRHIVTQSDRNGLGYALTIETSVYADGAEKHYEAYCVASGKSQPTKFRFDEQNI